MRRERAGDPGARDPLLGIRFALVELGVGIGAEHAGAQGLRAHARVAVDRDVAVEVAVGVGIVGESLWCLGREAVAGDAAHGGRESPVLAAGAVAQAALDRGVAAGARARGQALGFAGEDLDHAADRIGAPPRGARAAHDFDPLDLVQRQVFPGVGAGAGAGGTHAVDQDQALVGIGPAQQERGVLADAAGARDIDAGQGAQQLQQVGCLAAQDVVAREHADAGQALVDGRGAAGRGDHHGRLLRGELLRGGGPCDGSQQGCGESLDHGSKSSLLRTPAAGTRRWRRTSVLARTARAGSQGPASPSATRSGGPGAGSAGSSLWPVSGLVSGEVSFPDHAAFPRHRSGMWHGTTGLPLRGQRRHLNRLPV